MCPGACLASYNSNLRYVLRRKIPASPRILLIESGSRGVVEKLLPRLPYALGTVEVDLVTCYAGRPSGLNGTIFNVNEYGGPGGRGRLFADLTSRNYQLAGLLSTGEPIMTKWKWWLAYKLPAKIFVINESSEFFWCDWGNVGKAKSLALQRAGLTGGAVITTLARLILMPVTVVFLLTYAGTVHLRRAIRLL